VQKPVKAQQYAEPLQYMNYIGEQFNTLNEDLWNYVRTASHSKNVKKIESKRKELMRNAKLTKSRISRLNDFEGDGSYRDSVVNYLEITYHVLNDDFVKIVNMEKIAEESYDLMEAYLEAKKQANSKLDHAAEIVVEQQDIFAESFNITIIEKPSKISDKLKIATKVYDYYNQIYLIFFRSYKQESYALDAMAREDISGLEQNRKSMIQFSNSGQAILDTMDSYNEDHSIKEACGKLLQFYKDEANNDLSFFMEFIQTRDKLDELGKIMENKTPQERTSDETNEYNSLVNKFNSMVAEFNQKSEEINKTRNQLIDEWNKTSSKFINKHVP